MWLTLTTEGWCRLQRVRRTEPCLWDDHRDSGLVVGKPEQSLGESGANKKTMNTEKPCLENRRRWRRRGGRRQRWSGYAPYTYNPNTSEAQTRGLSQASLSCVTNNQASQGYRAKPVSKKQREKEKKREKEGVVGCSGHKFQHDLDIQGEPGGG